MRPYPEVGCIPARYDLLPAHWQIVNEYTCDTCHGSGLFFPSGHSDLLCSVCDGQGEMWDIEWVENLEPHTQKVSP